MSAIGGPSVAHFGRLLNRASQWGRSASGSSLTPRIAEIVSVAIAASAAAAVIGALFWPLPSPRIEPPRPAGESFATVVNPFGPPLTPLAPAGGAPTDAAEAADTALNLTLYGTWVEPDGGTATIGGADAKQKVYRIGDPICCGAILERVFPAHVLINRNGVVEALRLANKTAEPTTPAAGATVAAADFNSIVAVRPSVDATGRVTLTVTAGGQGPEGLSAIGLRENDVLVSVNGQTAPESMTDLPGFLQSVAGSQNYNVVVRRDGVAVPISFSIGANGARQEG